MYSAGGISCGNSGKNLGGDQKNICNWVIICSRKKYVEIFSKPSQCI